MRVDGRNPTEEAQAENFFISNLQGECNIVYIDQQRVLTKCNLSPSPIFLPNDSSRSEKKYYNMSNKASTKVLDFKMVI